MIDLKKKKLYFDSKSNFMESCDRSKPRSVNQENHSKHVSKLFQMSNFCLPRNVIENIFFILGKPLPRVISVVIPIQWQRPTSNWMKITAWLLGSVGIRIQSHRISVIRWLDYFSIFGPLKQWKCSQYHTSFAQLGSKILPNTKERF